MSKTLTLYDIVKTINQIVTDSKDLPPPHNKKIGMKREEIGERIQDRRVIDGFSAKFAGKTMRITYSSAKNVKEMGEDFQEEVRLMIDKIVEFIKKEFKNAKGSSLKLKNISRDEPFIFAGVQGVLEDNCRYSGYMDYEIVNAETDEPSNYEIEYEKSKKKLDENNFKNLERIFEKAYK